MRTLGSVEPVKLAGDADGVIVSIAHVGYGSVQSWDADFEFAKIRELSRLIKLRKELGLEHGCIESPQLFPKDLSSVAPVTPEGREEDRRIARKILEDCVKGVSVNGVPEPDPVGWIFARGLQAEAVVACIVQQTLRPFDPLVAGGDDLPPGSDPGVGHPRGGG
jgi:hypothetical protein